MYYNVIISNDAKNDIKKVVSFYHDFVNKLFSIKLTWEIFAKANTLNFMPERCKVFKWNIRVMIFDEKFKFFYEINEDKKEVYILKFAMSSQDDRNLFKIKIPWFKQ